MIWESRYWKADLLRFAEQLRRARTKKPPFTNRTYVIVEKAVLMGAFVIRRLADSHKLSDAVAAMQLRVTQIPSTGKRVTLLNNHRLAELFDFSRSARSRQSLPFLCNPEPPPREVASRGPLPAVRRTKPVRLATGARKRS